MNKLKKDRFIFNKEFKQCFLFYEVEIKKKDSNIESWLKK